MTGNLRYHRRRLADTAAALRLARTQVRREQRPRAQLASHQQQLLETVVRHAASQSPFYRRWFDQTGPLGRPRAQRRSRSSTTPQDVSVGPGSAGEGRVVPG
jgi:hypothetical protein